MNTTIRRRFVRVFVLAITVLTGMNSINAQDVYFFSDGTDDNFYDQGIVAVNNLGASDFEYTHPPGGEQWNDKVPCSTTAYKGSTSLKFNYTSSASGNWFVSIFRNDWSEADISGLDSLSFYIYSETEFPGAALPLIGLKAINVSGAGEVSSSLYELSDYNGDIPSSTWTRITFPLDIIMNDGANSTMDFSRAKAVTFNQSEDDNSSRIILIDEITAYKTIGDIPPVAVFTATGYDSHAELTWEQPSAGLSYRIYSSSDDGVSFRLVTETDADFYMDFVTEDERNKNITYRIVATAQDKESDPNEETVEIRDFTDDELMDMVQRYSFRYFWEGAHQETGMALERSNGNGRTAASGATGMGLMAMIVAHEREYQPKGLVKDRILMILDFLETCDRHHGAWSHWYNADTKKTQPFSEKDDGGDMVETSFVAAGLIAVKNYFTGTDTKSVLIREKADQLWKEIDWTWYRQGGQNTIYWHWSPNTDFEMNMQVRGWNEALITYIMAASSPTYGIPKAVYTAGWARNGNIVNRRMFYSIPIELSPNWGGPLFWLHYTHLGINPHGLVDEYADYWQEHVNTTKIHYEYAIDNPLGHTNYSAKCWGLTASDDPYGYTAHKPWDNDNGTISPTAALSSMPYLPGKVMKALKYFYRDRGEDLFGKYGPYDAFNDKLDWVKESYIGIDQGPIVVMIENHRTGLLWNNVMIDSDVQAGLEELGFEYSTNTDRTPVNPGTFEVFPNPGAGKVRISYPEWNNNNPAIITLYAMDGRLIRSEKLSHPDLQLNWSDLQDGIYLVRLEYAEISLQTRLVIHK